MVNIHTQLSDFLKKRDQKRFSQGKNTLLVRLGDDLAIQLHGSNVVVVKPDGSIVLDACGFKTLTTRQRMNEILGMMFPSSTTRKGKWIPAKVSVKISQVNRIWSITASKRVAIPKKDQKGEWDTHRWKAVQDVAFQDKMVVRPDGTFSGGLSDLEKRAGEKLRKAVQEFAKRFMEKFSAGEIGKPGATDCFYCSMQTTDGKNLGDETRDDHLKQHVMEGYYVPTMLYNAVKENPVSQMASHLLWTWCNPEDTRAAGVVKSSGEQRSMYFHMREQIEKSLVKYLFRRFGLAS